MGCCTGRCFLITLCVLQLLATLERLVFDFLGYMWAPIIGNFLQILFVIVGLFGACQYRPKVVIVYIVWCLLWIGWNVFVICFYLEVGFLSRESSILNIGTGNKSWWLDNGIGCTVNSTWTGGTQQIGDPRRDVPPEEYVVGCLLQYYYVEVIHAGVQCLLGLVGFVVACYVVFIFTEEDDSSQPVHDELEYIKMRYRSPARSSFRDNKTYETLATRSTYTTGTPSLDRSGLEQNYSDDSADRFLDQKKEKKYIFRGEQQQQQQQQGPDLPWIQVSPQMERQRGLDHVDPDTGQTYIGTNWSGVRGQDYISRGPGGDGQDSHHTPYPSPPPPSQMTYFPPPPSETPQYLLDLSGQTGGVTII